MLAPIIPRPEGLTVLLTLRAAHLRSHSGQVAFPGGKIDAGETPAETALREAREEIGLAPGLVEPLGWLDPYLTGTGYRVTALVALVDPAFTPTLNPDEVADVFETPFAFLMDAANHRLEERQWRGRTRKFYAMPHGERYIWGVTAGILRNLYGGCSPDVAPVAESLGLFSCRSCCSRSISRSGCAGRWRSSIGRAAGCRLW